MARTVKPEEYEVKRTEILNAAQRLMFTKGYEKMAIHDILVEVGISSGAFHHYFGSRAALLDAFIERIRQESDKVLLPVMRDPHLTAIEKLQGFFDSLDQGRMALKAEVVKIGQFWYNDDNALVRQRVDEAVAQQRAPLVAEIVRQGVREGSFTTTAPDKAGEVILTLLQGMGNTHARLLFSLMEGGNDERCIEEIVATHVAYMEAIERLLGGPIHSIRRTDVEAVQVWVRALREN
jgi:AcrR family transcriptional regulator